MAYDWEHQPFNETWRLVMYGAASIGTTSNINPPTDSLLQEDANFILQENGSFILI
jgi:hypothetical protein